MSLKWKGDQVKEQAIEAFALALQDFGLEHESQAKRELRPRRGKITGTLQRSIHAANPNYNWKGDDVEPSNSSPNRGGIPASVQIDGEKITVSVGSGLVYSFSIEKLYGYLHYGRIKALRRLQSFVNKRMRQVAK